MRTGEVKHKKQAMAKRTMLILCIGLPVLAIAGLAVSAPIRRHSKAQADVNALQAALGAYVSEQGELPHGSSATICRLLRGESVDGQNLNKLNYIEATDQELNAKGEILDPWGNPYRILLENGLRVYSCGSSGNDEHGKGGNISPK